METKARMEVIIDNLPLTLGDSIDSDILDDHQFRKVGLVRRLLTGNSVGRVLYTSDNRQMTCLAEDFSIFACTHSYLDEDRRWETRTSLFLEDGILQEVLFQVIAGRYAASNFIERFAEVCTEVLGEPEAPEPSTTRWMNGTAVVTTFLHRDGVHADFRFELKGN
jgi:hypothetical protein